MRHRQTTVGSAAIAGAFALAALCGALASAQAPAAKTVWDGAYTDAQATRATAVFGQSCANCHSLDATGTRPLVGDRFWQRNTQKTVGELLTYVRTNMPNGANAGSLPASSYNDVVALILKSNGLPAGDTELTPESVAAVQIIPKDGAGELPANTLVRVLGCLSKGGADWVLTNATTPVRSDGKTAAADEATRPLGDRTTALKFVLTRLDAHVGKRMAVTGMLMGAGGVDGINVATVSPVADTCP